MYLNISSYERAHFPLSTFFWGLLSFSVFLIGKSKYYKIILPYAFIFALIVPWSFVPIYNINPDAEHVLINATLTLSVGIVVAGFLYSEKKTFFVSILSFIDLYLFYGVYLGYPMFWITSKLFFLILMAIFTLIALKLRNNTYNRLIKQSEILKDQSEELKSQKEKAESADKAKSLFLANVSHEIRTPLNLISGYSKILSETSLTEEQLKHINTIQNGSNNLLQIIEDLLDLNLIEKGKIVLKYSNFDIFDFVENLTEHYKNRAIQKDLKFELSVDKNIPSILIGDSKRIRQVINNLINNAIKYTIKGSIKVSLDLINETQNNCEILLKVKDTGVGIPKKMQNTVFEAFVQGDPEYSQKLGGIGLGLSISKKLVDLMGAKIWFESEAYVGTSFFVKFKLAKPHKGYIHIPSIIIEPDYQMIRKSLKILIVDDMQDNLELLKLFLKPIQAEIMLAYDGDQAVELVKSNNYDLILMDIRMPKMDGNTAVKLIREWELNYEHKHNIPIIALTAYAMKDEQLKSLDAGFTMHLSKPVNKEALIEIVSQLTISALPKIENIPNEHKF
jgi:signal transduction histidine kinase/ActR/RegA family two-component response regulator